MGSLRSLLSESKPKRVPVFPVKRRPFTLYGFLEMWSENCPDDFTEVIGELYGGHRELSQYCLRDSLMNHYGFEMTKDRFHTEALEIIIELWEGKK